LIKRFHKRPVQQKQQYRINERIWASSLRVLNSEGKQIGILSKMEALQKAKEEELDLVEIAPTAKPPVAKIIDFKKFLYQQEKKQQEEKKKAKITETKEVRLTPFISTHDLETVTKRAQGFLGNGDKVRFVVKFAGRQITHPEFGYELLKKIFAMLSGLAKVEKEPRLEGKQLIAILAPERKQHAKEKNQQIS